MHPIFIAMGPSFKKGARVDTFNSVDVYPLMCKLLGLKPAPNNGSLGVVSQLLVDRLTEVDGASAFWICKYIIYTFHTCVCLFLLEVVWPVSAI